MPLTLMMPPVIPFMWSFKTLPAGNYGQAIEEHDDTEDDFQNSAKLYQYAFFS